MVKKLLTLTNFFKIQTSYIYKMAKVVIIYKSKNLMFITFQIILPDFEDFNNSKSLLLQVYIET